MRRLSIALLGVFWFSSPLPAAETIAELLQAGYEALLSNNFTQATDHGKKALTLAEKAVVSNPRSARAYLVRGRVHELLGQHKEAVADFSKTIELDPKQTEAYDRRGSEQFKLGNISESLADFDRFLKLQPEALAGHWKRGITLYYAAKYDDGRKQFEGYEKVDTNDVENAVWHFLCVARKDGAERARGSILKIGRDTRTPMMEVYELFAGKLKPEDVMRATERGEPTEGQKNTRLFYAHLYLGLYHETHGNEKAARKHLEEATEKHRIGHYMWDVARVHRDLLRKR